MPSVPYAFMLVQKMVRGADADDAHGDMEADPDLT